MSHALALLSLLLIALPLHAQWNIRDHGAVGDGQANDQQAIQAAIDAAHQAGGGKVLVPSGTYFTGTLTLKDNVTLHLTNGATLLASDKESDFTGKIDALIAAKDAQNIAITGEGTLRGRGELDRGKRYGVSKDYPMYRSRMIEFENCRNVRLTDVRILYSTRFTVVLERCDTVFIDRVTIQNNLRHLNSDGIDPIECRNVHISNCHIQSGDDSIVIKESGENIVVSNCTLISATTGVKLGTGTKADFRNIHFSNITIDAPTGIGFYMKDGGSIENVTFNQMSITNPTPEHFNREVVPIFMDIEKRRPTSPAGSIRDITLRDIRIQSGSGVLIQGMPEQPIQNLLIDNLTFRPVRADSYVGRRKPIGGGRSTRDERDTLFARQPTWIAIGYVDGLRLEDVRVLPSDEAAAANRTPLEVWGSNDVHIDGRSVDASALPDPVPQPEAPAPADEQTQAEEEE